MDDLDLHIWAWVDDALTEVEPVTADEVVTGGSSWQRPPGAPRHRRTLAIALVAAAAAVGGFAVFVPHDTPPSDTVRSGPVTATSVPGSDGWEDYTEPRLGWTLERPAASRFQAWQGRCEVNDSGTLITNQLRTVEWAAVSGGCSTGFSTAGLAQPGFVGLRISHHDGERSGELGPTPDDTPTGITIEDLAPAGDGSRLPGLASVEVSTMPVVIDGDARYSVTTWVADDADLGNVADLRRMVASISWAEPDGDQGAEYSNATGNPRTSAFLACMADRGYGPELALDPQGNVDGEQSAQVVWGDGDRDEPGFADDRSACDKRSASAADRFSTGSSPWFQADGASQPASDAERDGVVAAVAQLPLSDRALPLRWAETKQGVWAITRMASAPGGRSDADGCLGDRTGQYGTDYVCAREYGEIILVDPDDGSVRRSYPLPGMYPVWMHITSTWVYAGRVGDGAMPDSMIMRIDRETFEAETIVFPSHADQVDSADLASVDLGAMGWTTAPPRTPARDLVGGPGLPDGVLVDSTIGVTLVDLAAVDALFA